MLAALTKFYSGRAWAAGDTRQAPGLSFPNIGRYGIKSWPICIDDGFCLELHIDLLLDDRPGVSTHWK